MDIRHDNDVNTVNSSTDNLNETASASSIGPQDCPKPTASETHPGSLDLGSESIPAAADPEPAGEPESLTQAKAAEQPPADPATDGHSCSSPVSLAKKVTAKPVSTAKVNANRANSAKSTGPRTAEGKARSSGNAVKHGLFAAEKLLTPEDRTFHEALRQAYRDDRQPVGVLEEMVTDRIARFFFRDDRLFACEVGAGLMEKADRTPGNVSKGQGAVIGAVLDIPFGENLARITRYSTSFRRELQQDILLLQRLQEARRKNEMAKADKVKAHDTKAATEDPSDEEV